MKTIKQLLLAFLAISMIACSDGITISHDLDQSVDFNNYKTFSILPWPTANDSLINEFDKNRLINSIKQEFIARGMSIIENTSSADIAINMFVTAENKTEMQAYTNYYNTGYGYRYSPYTGMGGSSTTTVREYDYVVGSIIIDVFEVSGKKLIWQGVGQGVVDDTPNAKKKDENVSYAVAKILSPYPVEKIKATK